MRYCVSARENDHKLFHSLLTADVVTEFIEGLVETYPGLQYLDGLPEVTKKIFPFSFVQNPQLVFHRSRLYYELMFLLLIMTRLLLYQVSS